MPNRIPKIIEIFRSRLQTLDQLLATAEEQWKATGKNPDDLMAVRLADDMHPLSNQIAFTCNQPSHFVSWAADETPPEFNVSAATIAEGRTIIRETLARLDAAKIDEAQLSVEKKISLPIGIAFTLPGGDYVDDWLLPNFYFHMVTAYDILRREGVDLGKKDYMNFLMPTIMQQMAAAPSG